MAKRGTLSAFKASKGEAAPTAKTRTATAASKPSKGQTLRLNFEAWQGLKMLAVMQGVPTHDLLIEAVNDLFVKHGKKPVAEKHSTKVAS